MQSDRRPTSATDEHVLILDFVVTMGTRVSYSLIEPQ